MQHTLAQKLRVVRAQKRLTLRQAAKKLRVTPGTLSELERGLRHPHDVTLAKIAEGYGVPVEELLEEPVLAGKAEAPKEAGPDATEPEDFLPPSPADMHRITDVLYRIIEDRHARIEGWRRRGIEAIEEATCGSFDIRKATDAIYEDLQELGADRVLENPGTASPQALDAAHRQLSAFNELLNTAIQAKRVAWEFAEKVHAEAKAGFETFETFDEAFAAVKKR